MAARGPRRVDRAIGARPRARPTEINFLSRIAVDEKTRAAKHRFHAGAVRYPPIRIVARIAIFDERQMRIARPLEDCGLAEGIILVEGLLARIAALHRLADEQIADDVHADEVERQ